MEEYFVNNRAGYAFPRGLSIFRNLAWRLLILEIVVERIPCRPQCWLRGWSAPSFLSTTDPLCCARRLRACLRKPIGRSKLLLSMMGRPTKQGSEAEALAEAHSEVRTIHRKNGGPGAARETGRLAARGEFIQYLDSDDLLLPTKFELQVAGLRQCGGLRRLLWKNALLRLRGPPERCGMETDWRAHFDDVSLISAIALVGYIDPSLSARGDGFGRSMDLS